MKYGQEVRRAIFKYANKMSTLDFNYAPLAALACICTYCWLLWKYPSGVVFIGFTTNGIAWVSFGSALNYANAIFYLQLLSAFIFTYIVINTRGINKIVQFFSTRYSLFAWFMLIIWLKIGFDILYYGMDDFKLGGLKIAVQTVFLPGLVFYMAAVSRDPWRFATGIMIGMVAFALAFVLPTLPGMIAEGRIINALTGLDRLTIYNMDTISGGRFFFIGVLGAMTLISTGGLNRTISAILIAVFLLFFTLLLLNGTRQYIVGVIVAGSMCFYSFIRTSGIIRHIFLIAVSVAVIYLSYSIFQTAEVGLRFSGESIAREVAFSRGAIWLQVLQTGLEHPFTGVGFREFGDVIMVAGQTEGSELVENLSGAHGFFQDICAEHGIILAVIGVLIFTYSVRLVFLRIQIEKHSVVWAHYAALVGLLVPLFMSGYVLGSSGMYLFALSMYVAFAKHKIDQAQQYIINMKAIREAAEKRRMKAFLNGRI
jgi:hypothetical protein